MIVRSLKGFGKFAAGLALSACATGSLIAQNCTTQARMEPAMRQALADAALAIGSSIKTGDATAVKAATVPDLASNFGATESIIRSTAPKISASTLRVTQVYELDATSRKASDTGNVEFSCILSGTSAETDFSVAGLPPGDFGFAMVEAAGGDHPWLLSLLLQKNGTAWKMAGLYPRARSAAGHDGVWYWTAARQRASAKENLLSWLYYTQADALLQPAPFIDTTNLDKLRTEQRSAAPPEAANGLSADSPIVLKSAGGAEFRVTSITSEASSDDKSLHLVMHLVGSAGADDQVNRGRSEGAARALVATHPELKQAFSAVYVFADLPGANPQVVSLDMSQIQ